MRRTMLLWIGGAVLGCIAVVGLVRTAHATDTSNIKKGMYCRIYKNTTETGPGGAKIDPGCDTPITMYGPDGKIAIGHACPGLDCEWYTSSRQCGTCVSGKESQTCTSVPAGTATIYIKKAGCAAVEGSHGSNNDCSISNCPLLGKACACPDSAPSTGSNKVITCECD
jgi:hypothetical protein